MKRSTNGEQCLVHVKRRRLLFVLVITGLDRGDYLLLFAISFGRAIVFDRNRRLTLVSIKIALFTHAK